MGKALAFIPARGGSKRLPRKNLLPFMGLPLLVHTVRAAIESGLFRQVVFSSDDGEMLKMAASHGAEPLLRPTNLATDQAPLVPAVAHASQVLNWPHDSKVCLLMPNCPLRSAADIVNSYAAFGTCDSDFMISVFRYQMFNPRWALSPLAGSLSPHFREEFSQAEGPELLCPSGAIWWARLGPLLENGDFYGPGLKPFILPWYRAVDIDTEEDLRMARIIAAALEAEPGLFK